MGMSIKGYARLRGVDPKAIRRAIATGVITVDGNGKLDVAQADRAWASTRRASRMGQHQHSDAGTRSARSKIVVALAKLRLAKQRYETMRELYVDREAALELAAKEADLVLAFFRGAPAAYAEQFASELGIDVAQALRILDRFMTLALEEIGDLKAQAISDAQRA